MRHTLPLHLHSHECVMLLLWLQCDSCVPAGRWNISVFIVLLIRSFTVLTCALINLARDGTNPFGNRCVLFVRRPLPHVVRRSPRHSRVSSH